MFILPAFSLFVACQFTAPESNDFNYTIAKGDTLTSIAKKFGTTVAAIVRLNNIADPNKISVGQVIKIPGSSGGTMSSD
ncbi:putative LysM domain containing protein [Blattamonas nauphoetae]|uniref:LysM domain containing protein n=1 Tax=Blattamonas nauphoetae TaxID=2049346 RepID=A0ABQ9Y1I2_9EUKA|nr:putative LysM domain containing protein [Blattamonas nauphoetae]